MNRTLLTLALLLAACSSGSGTHLLTSYSLDFGQVVVGASAQKTITLANGASTAYRLTNIDPSTDPDFSIPSAGNTVPANGKLDLAVVFAPTASGTRSGAIVLHTDDPDATAITLNLTGEGAAACSAVTPQTVDFGSVVIHTTSTKTVTLTNCTVLDLQVTPGALQGASAALFAISETAPFTLKAGNQASIDASYAPLVPSALDSASFALTFSDGKSVTVTLNGTATEGGLRVSPAPMDFNFVQAGGTRTIPLHLENVGNTVIAVTSIAVTVSAGAFALTPDAPLTANLSPGEGIDVPVVFSPTNQERYDGELDVTSSDSVNVIPMALIGYGGGAAITCTPATLDFGAMAVGFSVTVPITCVNTGSDIPAGSGVDPHAELQIVGFLVSDGGPFSATAPSSSLLAGQSVQIPVTYSPTGAESDVATLTVLSNVTTPPAPPVLNLTGHGVHLGPCHWYAVSPTSLDWGSVTPASTTTQAFTIANLGPNECLLWGLGLLAGSDPAFTLPSVQAGSQFLSPPGAGGPYPTSLTVPVRFGANVEGSYAGQVGFSISDPSYPLPTVPLSAVVANSCFTLSPAALVFPTAGLTSAGQLCQTEQVSFVAVNGCTEPVLLEQLTTVGSDAFSFLAYGTPETLDAGATSSPFLVAFKPPAPGAYYAEVQLQAGLQPTPFGLAISGTALDSGTLTDTFTVPTNKVDLLLVVDTSNGDSLGTTLAGGLGDFLTAAADVDYQIGVTTTDVCHGENGKLLPCPGCKVDGGFPLIVTPADANAAADLSTLLNIGVNFGMDHCGFFGPEFLEAASEASRSRTASAPETRRPAWM